ncbi:MAG: histidine phosphatase family protein [Pikeienuella sp.]
MIFYRHPTPDAQPGLCYGRLDIGLSDEATSEIAAAVADPPVMTRILTSPAKRALALAEALADATGAALIPDERLWEMNFGAWEGKFWSEIDRADSDPWAENPWDLSPPGGESYSMVHSRMGAVLLDALPGDVIVAHAGPIRAAKMILEGLTFAEAFADPVPFATPVTLELREDR